MRLNHLNLIRVVKPLSVSFLITLMVLPYQNCSVSRFEAPESASGSLNSEGIITPSPTPTVLSGTDLYNKNCLGCHGPLDGPSTKVNRTVSQITNAIKTVPTMTALNTLTSQQVTLIAEALIYVAPQPPQDAEIQNATLNLGNRIYVASSLENLFINTAVTQTADDTTIKNTIHNLVRNQIASFGGPCYRYDYTCPGGVAGGRSEVATNHYGLGSPLSNAMRSGFKIRVCDEVLQVDRAVTNALTNAGLVEASAANETTIKALAGIVTPGRPLDTEVITALVAVFDTAKAKSLSNRDAWRFTIFPLCVSSLTERL